MKNKKFKNWSIGIFHFTFSQLVFWPTNWSERVKEANFEESD